MVSLVVVTQAVARKVVLGAMRIQVFLVAQRMQESYH